MKFAPLTLALALINVGLAASLGGLMLKEEGTPSWETAATIASALAPPATVAPLAPLSETLLASGWQQPLFSPGRLPDVSKVAPAASSGLDGVTLSGVVIDGDAQWALLRLPDRRFLKLRRGEALAGDWTLASLGATSATFSRQGQARTLDISVPRLPPSTSLPVIKRLDVQVP